MGLPEKDYVSIERRASVRYQVPRNALIRTTVKRRALHVWLLGEYLADPCWILDISHDGVSFETPQVIGLRNCFDIRTRWKKREITLKACRPVQVYPVNPKQTIWLTHASFNRRAMSPCDTETLDSLFDALAFQAFQNLHSDGMP